jgi:hypothetical protein
MMRNLNTPEFHNPNHDGSHIEIAMDVLAFLETLE